MIYFRSLVLAFCLLFSFALDAQKTLSENAKISLLTCGSGDEAYSTFGHTAIRVKDVAQDIDYAFHYGLFDFNDPDFYPKFLRGKLMYSMGAQTIEQFKRQYTAQERTVYEQKLNLDQAQKQAVYTFLLDNYQPENREYLYDFFFNNCGTIVRDRFDSIFPGLQYPKYFKKISFRQMLDEHLTKMPWTDFGIDLIIGSIADRRADQSEQFFLPLYIHDYYAKTFIDGKPLVEEEELMLDFIEERSSVKESIFTPWNVFFLLFAIELSTLAGFLVMRERKLSLLKIYDNLWYLILGIGGLVLLFMWFGTDHLATKTNWNVVWMNPLYLALLAPGKWMSRNNKKWLATLLMVLNLISAVGLIKIFQYIHPVSALIALLMAMKLFRYRSTLSKSSIYSEVEA